MYFILWHSSRYPQGYANVTIRRATDMIFRQFLAAKTGCASYVFG
jgi:hypothetical protein